MLAEKGGVSAIATREAYPRVATLPFDAAYKMMATFHAMKDERGQDVIRAFVKGAPDQLLARGTTVITPDLSGTVAVDDAMQQRYLDENERLGSKGLRVMATGRKDFDPKTFDANADLLPLLDGMTLLALVGIVDPPRPAAKVSIADAHSAGIQVRMITGDHAVTAEAIAKDLGIPGRAITGAEFRAMSDDEALAQLDDIGVIARVTPEDKVHLVDLLRMKGHIVAMTGDGVNDAPALKKADIGVAMGITGTEVSKEAANMILTDDDFSTIVKAVELGRGLYDNLKKYIRFQVGLLIGYIFTFLGSSILNVLGGVPFFPLQTLFMNFTIQVFQAVGLGYGKPSLGLMERKPRPSNEALLGRRLLYWLVVAGGVMGLSTLAVLSWANNTYGDPVVARTMGMITFSVSNVAFSFVTKDERHSVFSLDVMGDRPFLYATLASIAFILLIPNFDFFNRILDTTSLSLEQWAICLVAGLLILVVGEVRKLVWKADFDEAPAGRRAGDRAGRRLTWRTSRASPPRELRDAIKPFRVEPGRKVRLPKDFDPRYAPDGLTKKDAGPLLRAGIELLAEYQARLAAQDTYGLLVVFQAMDAAGKDGTIKHVMSGVNPQGVEVSSFKVPSPEELDHDYLWRYAKRMPGRGTIGIFNRSLLRGDARRPRPPGDPRSASTCPTSAKGKDVWARRFREINDWERYLTDNGIRIVKLFLNVSPRGAEAAVHRPDRRARAQLEVLRRRHPRARSAGTTTSRPSPRCSATRAPSTRRGT